MADTPPLTLKDTVIGILNRNLQPWTFDGSEPFTLELLAVVDKPQADLAAAREELEEWRRAFALKTSSGWQTPVEAEKLQRETWQKSGEHTRTLKEQAEQAEQQLADRERQIDVLRDMHKAAAQEIARLEKSVLTVLAQREAAEARLTAL